jgi:hypothetical protein
LLKAKHFDLEATDMSPWQPIISDPVNGYIGESEDNNFKTAAANSVFGILYRKLTEAGFDHGEFPDMFQTYARNIHAMTEPNQTWGQLALSVPVDNWPKEISIKTAYEMREPVAIICRHYGISDDDKPSLCAMALANILITSRDAIDRKTAILLACEIVVGVAKRVPMPRRIIEQKPLN